MGSDNHHPEEGPAHSETVPGFWIEKYTVTNEGFARFAEEMKYVTLAERPVKAEDYPGAHRRCFSRRLSCFASHPGASSCAITLTGGAVFAAPTVGIPKLPQSSIKDRQQHPVVHLAYEDAEA